METNKIFNFYNPSRLYFGLGELNQLNTYSMPGKKALLIISNGKSSGSNGDLSAVEEQLNVAVINYVVFYPFIKKEL